MFGKKMKKIVAAVLCLCALLTMAACDDLLTEKKVEYAPSQSAEYNAMLTDARIVHVSPVFGTNNASYVSKDDDGWIYCEDYAYNNKDLITSWSETVFIPLAEDASDEQIATLETQLRANAAEMEALDCCTVTYTQMTSYYKVCFVFKDVDKEAAYKEVYEAELTTENAPISMKSTEDDLIKEGYLKK